MADKSPLDLLQEQFAGRDWFHSVGTDQYGRYVVYAKYMCHETLYDIPDRLEGKQVLCHFAASKTATRETYTNPKKSESVEDNIPFELIPDVTDEVEFIEEPNAPLDLRELIKELDKMERVCGSNIMQDIFYEVHDKNNAVTNLSAKFPDVRKNMEKLYAQYGFDLIYENMDG